MNSTAVRRCHKRGSARTWTAVGFVAWLLGAGSPPATATDGVEPIGLSVQSLNRGGADVAVGDTALSQIENPATLPIAADGARRFDLAGELLMPDYEWSGRYGSAHSTARHIPLGHGAFATPLNERLTLGVALYSKSQLDSRYTMRQASYPHLYRRFTGDMRDIGLAANLGFRSTPKLSLGVGLRGEFATARFTSLTGPATIDFGRGYAFGGGFQLGLHYQALPALAFGLGYRSPTWFQDLTGEDSRSEFAGEWQGSLAGLRPAYLGKASIADIRLPQKLSAGLAWDVIERLKLVGEVRWIDYSASVLDDAEFVFHGPFRWRLRSPIGYRDQWAAMAGTEIKLSQHWILGCGYHYASNPIRRSALLPITAVIPRHHVTAGLRYERNNWWCGGGYVIGLADSLRAHRRSDIPFGVDYADAHIRQMEHSVHLGLGFTW